MNAAIVDFINVHRDRYVDELKQFLAIPSVSALASTALFIVPLIDSAPADRTRGMASVNPRC